MPQAEMADASDSAVAIIGMSGRFPGAGDVETFWRNLRQGVESISFFSEEELLAAGQAPELIGRADYVKARGMLEGIELFDAAFFGFQPREAEILDPQQRLFLECAWEALENAGYDAETYAGAIGVFAGAAASSYLFHIYTQPELLKSVGRHQAVLGNDKDFLATRVSYKLNLKGPSVVVQTACSTSLVAVHLACQSLLNMECDMALAGGVAVKALAKTGYIYHDGGILSPDGHCRAFSAEAQGTVDSDGVGVVLLKRLPAACADGDSIYAVIRGSAINNDGSLKVGFTAPSIDGQAKAITEALAVAQVEPEALTYVEAHGTGTALGDPIEVAALTKAFRTATQKKGFCALGSVKSNLGHLDTAAGVAGLIKTALALKHGLLPPSLHCATTNPHIDFEHSPFYVNRELNQWTPAHGPRVAGVSSFGIGGTNAHMIVAEAPAAEPSGAARPWHLLVLSAKTSAALELCTERLAVHLDRRPGLSLADVAYTLQVGRRSFNHRRILLCRDASEAVAALQARDPKQVRTRCKQPGHQPLAFMFPGQGAQHVNMGRELYEHEPLFRAQVNLCAEVLKPRLGLDLRDVLYPSAEMAGAAAAQLAETCITQPALFTVEYALAKLWTEWVGAPQAMIGHSIGEYVAACLAGVFSVEDALGLVVARGQLMQSVPRGAMLSVRLPADRLEPLLGEHLCIAAVNGESSLVVSGPSAAVEELAQRLASAKVSYRQLQTSHAFHSAMIDAILQPLTEQVSRVALRPPERPFISGVTGGWITPSEATNPAYWAEQARRTVRFADGLTTLLSDEQWALLEVGPGRALGAMVAQHPQAGAAQVVLASLPHPLAPESDVACLLRALGQLWLEGLSVNWPRVYAHERRLRVPLPSYPFERKRCWLEPSAARQQATTRQPTAPPRPAEHAGRARDNGDPAAVDAAALEQLIEQQLQVITQQLSLLGNAHSADQPVASQAEAQPGEAP